MWGNNMPNLSIRKLDQNVYRKLRARATKHRVSMEEEVRQIISQAVSSPDKMSQIFQSYFGSDNGIDLDFLEQRKPHKPMDFDK